MLGLFFCFAPVKGLAQDANAILDSADVLFKSMKGKDYKNIWNNLSAGSKNLIINDTLKAIKKSVPSSESTDYSAEALERDFASGGPIAKGYWDGYMDNFNPNMVLEESKWTMGPIAKGKAEIVIQYKKAEKPARLQMVLEQGKWKVALIETFRYSAR